MRKTIIEAIGYFVNIIESEKLENDLAKILPGILNLYKKHPETYVVSQALCMIISAINESKIHSIEALLENVLKELFIQVLATCDNNANTNQVKNQNELLRCFTELCKLFKFIFLYFHFFSSNFKHFAFVIKFYLFYCKNWNKIMRNSGLHH